MPTVLITGANRGLGLELCRQYAGDAWTVLACCRASQEAAELRSIAGQVIVRELDVADFAAIERLAHELRGTAIDVLVNNAGVFGPKARADDDPRQLFGHVDYDVWQALMRVNTLAPMRMAEAFVDHVAGSVQKKIVTISSTEGSISRTTGGLYAYKTSKAAVNMVMRNLAFDLRGLGIVTASICPGWVRTRMGGSGATLEPATSIAGVRKVIAGLTLETSGQFWLYTGETRPW